MPCPPSPRYTLGAMDRRGRRAHSDDLTLGDWELLRFMREGLDNAEIAERLGISQDEVERRVSQVESRLGATGMGNDIRRPRRLSLPQPFRLRIGAGRSTLAVGIFATLVAVAAVVALVWALPAARDNGPGYPSSPEAVIIQVKTTSYATWDPWLAERLNAPQFTLYGDGTLIFKERGELGFDPQPMRTKVPDDTIRDLLQFMVDEGFMSFAGEQPRPEGQLRPTTYLYAQTSEAANTVSAYALDSELPPDAGEEWAQFWRLQLIVERLHETAETAALDDDLAGEYVADAVLLIVEPRDTPVKGSSTNVWGPSGIDLAQIAPPGSGRVEQRIESDLGWAGWRFRGTMSQMSIEQGDRYFDLYARPLLPFEENFPDFDEP